MRFVFSAALLWLAATLPAAAQPAPSADAIKDLAPSGKLRAAINFGNGVLAQKGKDGEPHGITADLSHELGKRLGVPVELVQFAAAGKAARGAGQPARSISASSPSSPCAPTRSISARPMSSSMAPTWWGKIRH